jgi:hypothetical protein
MIEAYDALHAVSTGWAISPQRENTRCVVSKSGARETYGLVPKASEELTPTVCAIRRHPSRVSERLPPAKQQ